MSRLLIVSHRLPVTTNLHETQGLVVRPSPAGLTRELAIGVASLDASIDRLWVGWPGVALRNPEEHAECVQKLQDQKLFPVVLTKQDIDLYFEGFCNGAIWPLFHYFPQFVNYSEKLWNRYVDVNARFVDAVVQNLKAGDMVWVQGHELMLVPEMLRTRCPELSIGFFLHIPFPSPELFSCLPWRRAILNGLLGADMIGFHTFSYLRHFLDAVSHICGHDHSYLHIKMPHRMVKCNVVPMGIDYDAFAVPADAGTLSPELLAIKESSEKGKIVLSVDRLDYTKGMPNRIKAYEMFLEHHPEYHRKVTLVMVVAPSPVSAHDYAVLKNEIELLCGRINGSYGTFGWLPIHYFSRTFSLNSLCALYQYSQVALVTPLRDGMNLVAKEYVASKETIKSGVLILSEKAGAAKMLDEALLVNPMDIADMANAIHRALEMPLEEQQRRMKFLQHACRLTDVKVWAKQFLRGQVEMKNLKECQDAQLLTEVQRAKLVQEWAQAKRKLLMADYGGTLRPPTSRPEDGCPDEELLQDLRALKNQPGATVVLTTGRHMQTMRTWFASTGVDLVAEFGACVHRDGVTTCSGVDVEWKQHVRPVLDRLAYMAVGSWVEEKEYTLAWHYRNTDKELTAYRLREIKRGVTYCTTNHNLQVVAGNCVVEVRSAEVSKGRAAKQWVGEGWDCVVCVGAFESDDDVFEVMPAGAWCIKVGITEETEAGYKVRDINDVRALLHELAGNDSTHHTTRDSGTVMHANTEGPAGT